MGKPDCEGSNIRSNGPQTHSTLAKSQTKGVLTVWLDDWTSHSRPLHY